MVTSSGSPSEMVAETSPESDHAILLPTAFHGSRTPSPQILDCHSHPCGLWFLPTAPAQSCLLPAPAISVPIPLDTSPSLEYTMLFNS